MTLGTRIKERREQLGLTQLQLAEIIGVREATICRYENGVIKNPPQSKLKLLVEALKVEANYLMDWEDKEDIPNIPNAKVYPSIHHKIEIVREYRDHVIKLEHTDIYDHKETPNYDFALCIKSEVMMPYVRPGDVVLIKRCHCLPKCGKMVLIVTEKQHSLRYMYRCGDLLCFVSPNPSIRPIISKKDDEEVLVLGVTVGFCRDFNY